MPAEEPTDLLPFPSQIYADEEHTELTGTMVVGRIVKFHARKDLFGETGAIDTAKMLPVSRLGGIGYGRTIDAYGKNALVGYYWLDFTNISRFSCRIYTSQLERTQT